MFKDLYEWTIHWASTPYAVFALFVIAFAESSFFPIPPDFLLIPICLADPDNALFYAFVCTVASVLGGAFGYGLGRFGGRPVMNRLFKSERTAGVERLYQKYEGWAIGIAAFTPIPFKVFTVSAGVFRVNFKVLVMASILGRGGRFFLVGALIYFFGAEIRDFIDRYFELLTIAVTVLLLGGFVVMKFVLKPLRDPDNRVL